MLIKAELVHHFSKEEIEFEEFLSDDNVDFSSLIAEHEKTIGLFDRIKYLSHDFSLKANYEKIKDVNEDLIKGYDIFTPIAATDLGFDPGIPVVEAGPILFRIPAMSAPVYDNIEAAIKEHGLS